MVSRQFSHQSSHQHVRGFNVSSLVLIVTQTVVGALAVFGGLRMVADGFDLPASWLTGTGFSSWALPGVSLILAVALPQLTAAFLLLARRPSGALVAMLVGGVLMAWIVVQLAVLQRYFFLQPVIFTVGALQVALGVHLMRSRAHREQRQRATSLVTSRVTR
jgi:hypothetical protein